jgi:hypothetical protein
MLFSEIMTAYRDNHKKIINRICGQNAEICDFSARRRVCGIIEKLQVVIRVKDKTLYKVNLFKNIYNLKSNASKCNSDKKSIKLY